MRRLYGYRDVKVGQSPGLPAPENLPEEPNVELFRGRTQFGNRDRLGNAWFLEPHRRTEIHAEHEGGDLTWAEREVVRKWFYPLSARREPLRPQGWFRRLLDLLRSF
jgi:hypothetical protein